MDATTNQPVISTADDSNQPTDWQEVERINAIKEKLRDLSWDQIKNDNEIITNAISNSGNYDVDPAAMLTMEKVATLAKLFSNYRDIPKNKGQAILERFIKFNPQRNFAEFPQEIVDLAPNLQVKNIPSAQLAVIQKDTVSLVNGLKNIENISLLLIMGEISTDIQSISRISPQRLAPLVAELNNLITSFQAKLDQHQDLTKEEVVKAADFLRNFGRTSIETERIKNMTDNLQLITVLRNVQEASEVVLEAYKLGVANRLNDLNIVADLLVKVKNR